MTSYYIFFALEFALILFCAQARTERQRQLLSWIAITVLTLFSGLRGLVGFDTAGYHEIFRQIDLADYPGGDWLLFEPLFSAVMGVVKLVVNDPYFFMFVVSFLQGCILIKICKFYRRPWVFLLIYVSGFYLQNQFNILRAGVAVLLLVYAYLLREDGEDNVIALLAAIFFHYSALLGAIFLIQGQKNIRLVSLLGLAVGALLFFGAGDRVYEKFAFYFLESSFYGSGSIVVGPYFVLTTLLAICAHWLINRDSNMQMHALFAVVLVFKVLQLLFPILWRSYDLLYFLWLAISGYRVPRQRRAVGVLVIVAIVSINFLFVTLSSLLNEEENLAARVNQTGEIGLLENESPFVPYRSVFE